MSLGIDGWERGEGHEVLEAVAAAGFDCDSQGGIWILIFNRNGVQSLLEPLKYIRSDRWKEERKEHTCAALGVISIFMNSPSSSRFGLYMHLVSFKLAEAVKGRL